MQNAIVPAAPGHLLTPRAAISIVFLCFGLAMGLWGGSVAEVARLAGASPAFFGTAFTGFAIAGILGMAVAGRIAVSVSLKRRLIILLLLKAACLIALFHSKDEMLLVVGLFLFSFFSASVDLVMNSEAIAVENDRGAPTMLVFHGLASVGVACGSLAGSYLSVSVGIPQTVAVVVALFAVSITSVAVGTPERGATQPAGSGSTWFRPSGPFLILGVIVGISIACELSAAMFSAKALTQQQPSMAAWAGMGGLVYAFCQAGVRLAGDHLRLRYGDRAVIRYSLATVVAGMVLVTASPSVQVTIAGMVLVGFGTACLVPCGMALAPRYSGLSAAASISMLSIIGAPFRIFSPLAYGALAAATSFTAGYAVFAAMAFVCLLLAIIGLRPPEIRRTQ